MSMLVFQDDNEKYIDYFSLKKLQHETKEYRLNNNLLEPKFNYNDNPIIYTILI
jgi:hypothetical protein